MQPVAFSSVARWKRKFLFSRAQRSLYDALRRITPNHSVFAKVRLGDVISASKRNNPWSPAPNEVGSKRLDFLICDPALSPIVAVELDETPESKKSVATRDQFVDRALAAAAVSVVRLPVKRSYALDEVRRLILPYLHRLGPAC